MIVAGVLRASVGGEEEVARSTFGALGADDCLFTRTEAGLLGALGRVAAVDVTVARSTAATGRQSVVPSPAQRAARVRRSVAPGRLRRTRHVLQTRALTGCDVTHWTRRAESVALTRCHRRTTSTIYYRRAFSVHGVETTLTGCSQRKLNG